MRHAVLSAFAWICVLTALTLTLFAFCLTLRALWALFLGQPLTGIGFLLAAIFEAGGAIAWLQQVDELSGLQKGGGF